MKNVLHVAVVFAVVGVLGAGYWSSARASNEGSGSLTQELEITGTIDAIDAGGVTIGGVLYGFTDQTEKDGLLEAGQVVKLEYVDNGDGTFTVLEIENESEDDIEDSESEDLDEDDDEDEDEDEDEVEDEEEDDEEDDVIVAAG